MRRRCLAPAEQGKAGVQGTGDGAEGGDAEVALLDSHGFGSVLRRRRPSGFGGRRERGGARPRAELEGGARSNPRRLDEAAVASAPTVLVLKSLRPSLEMSSHGGLAGL